MMRLIALDVDGTILNSQHVLTPVVHDALCAAQARGVTIVLATGKLIYGIEDLISALDLTGPVITCNGGAIHRASDGSLLRENTMTGMQCRLSRSVLTRYAPELPIVWYTTNALLSDKPNAALDEILASYHEPPLVIVPGLDGLDPPPIKLLVSASPERLDVLRVEVEPDLAGHVQVVRSAPRFLECMTPGVTKGVALREIQRMLGVSRDETAAIGDAENDIPLLAASGIGIAMGNGSPEIKAQATWVTASNDEDGVALALDRLARM